MELFIGSGDESTTFNLPNLVDKFIQGSSTVGTIKAAGLPNISGGLEIQPNVATNVNNESNAVFGGPWGGFAIKYGTRVQVVTTQQGVPNFYHDIGFDFYASRSNSIYGNSATVQPPALTMLFCIKY